MKTIALAFGALLLAMLWLGPLPTLAKTSFSAHMTLHMGVVAVAAPLLAIGVAARSWDPVRRWPGWFPAVPLSLLELLLVWGWHAPALHRFARHTWVGLYAEQGSFLIAGLLVWLAAFGGGSERRTQRAGAGVAALLLTSMHMTLLGALLALTPRALYAHENELCDFGLTALEDQHVGGAIMLAVGGVSYLAGGLWLTTELVRRSVAAREARI